jgi:hypothetical protein
MSGVEAGNATALVSVLPGADVHELPSVELPSAGAGATVPVVLPVTVPTMVTGMAVGKVGDRLVLVVGSAGPDMPVMAPIALIAAVGLAEALVLVDVTLSTDGESSTSVGAQFTLVPGSVGSCASGGGSQSGCWRTGNGRGREKARERARSRQRRRHNRARCCRNCHGGSAHCRNLCQAAAAAQQEGGCRTDERTHVDSQDSVIAKTRKQ